MPFKTSSKALKTSYIPASLPRAFFTAQTTENSTALTVRNSTPTEEADVGSNALTVQNSLITDEAKQSVVSSKITNFGEQTWLQSTKLTSSASREVLISAASDFEAATVWTNVARSGSTDSPLSSMADIIHLGMEQLSQYNTKTSSSGGYYIKTSSKDTSNLFETSLEALKTSSTSASGSRALRTAVTSHDPHRSTNFGIGFETTPSVTNRETSKNKNKYLISSIGSAEQSSSQLSTLTIAKTAEKSIYLGNNESTSTPSSSSSESFITSGESKEAITPPSKHGEITKKTASAFEKVLYSQNSTASVSNRSTRPNDSGKITVLTGEHYYSTTTYGNVVEDS